MGFVGNIMDMAAPPSDARAPAPPPLDALQSLVNTWFGRITTGEGDEGLQSPADLARWCREHGTDIADREVTGPELELARAVREGIRAALARHNDAEQPADADALDRLDQVAAGLQLHTAFGGGSGPRLEPPGSTPVRRLMATLLGAAVLADRDRTWQRLKVCREPRCRAAFYDTSRNNSGVWCSMSACGAAAKQRAFVERRRAKNAAARRAAAP
jgi:predicted RNA-binding Zn ribbon-like protein